MCFAGLLLLTPSASFHIAASFIFQLSPSYLPAISQRRYHTSKFPHKMEAEAHFLNWNEHSISAESGCVNHTQH